MQSLNDEEDEGEKENENENCTNIWNVRWSHCGKATTTTTTTNGTEVGDGMAGVVIEINYYK